MVLFLLCFFFGYFNEEGDEKTSGFAGGSLAASAAASWRKSARSACSAASAARQGRHAVPASASLAALSCSSLRQACTICWPTAAATPKHNHDERENADRKGEDKCCCYPGWQAGGAARLKTQQRYPERRDCTMLARPGPVCDGTRSWSKHRPSNQTAAQRENKIIIIIKKRTKKVR